MSSAGQKVTTDPRSKQEINEAVGVVTSDSLAADSLKGSGGFGEGNEKAAASKQPSKSTTTNTTDTSGARELAPAPDAETRKAQEDRSESAQSSASEGLGGKGDDKGPTYAQTSATGGVPGTESTGGTGVPIAPTGAYAGSAEAAQDPGVLKPKGKNITEGGFDSDAPNASFNAEIGSKDDPARAAEQKMQLSDAQPAGNAAGGAKREGVTGNTPYDALNSDQNA